MVKEIQEQKIDRFGQIETVLQNLKRSEDQAIHQLISGEITVGSYCNWLVGN